MVPNSSCNEITPEIIPRHTPTIEILVVSGAPWRIAQANSYLLAGAEIRWLALDPSEWNSISHLIKRLRHIEADAFAIAVRTLKGRRNPVLLKTLTLIPQTRRRWLLDEEGRTISCSRGMFLLADLPLLAVRVAASIVVIITSYLLILPLHWLLHRTKVRRTAP